MEWINVKNELPKKDSANLCYDSHHNMIRVLSYNDYHNCWDDEHADDYYTDAKEGYVTHWMPLPEPPKKE